MPFDFQIAVDAAEPHALADWWAETLGWVVEPSDEAFIRKMIAAGYATDEDTITHNGAMVWRDGAAIRHPDELIGCTQPPVLFQLVPEGNRCQAVPWTRGPRSALLPHQPGQVRALRGR